MSHVPPPSPTVTLCSVPGSCQAILHPDTNEKIFMPFRMSGKPLGPSGSAQPGPLTVVIAPGTSRCASLRRGQGLSYTRPHWHLHVHLGSRLRPGLRVTYGAFRQRAVCLFCLSRWGRVEAATRYCLCPLPQVIHQSLSSSLRGDTCYGQAVPSVSHSSPTCAHCALLPGPAPCSALSGR